MTRLRWSAGFVVVVLVALAMGTSGAPAAPTQTAPKLFKFKFTAAMNMDWQWPVNPNNQNRRDTGSFDVLKGSGCGTKPARSRWKIRYKIGDLPAQSLIVDFVYGGATNPALLADINYAGDPGTEVKPFLRFSGPRKPKVTLIGRPTGDVVGLTIDPKTAKVTRRRVARCPL